MFGIGYLEKGINIYLYNRMFRICFSVVKIKAYYFSKEDWEICKESDKAIFF